MYNGIKFIYPMKKVHLGDILQIGDDTGEVCFVSGTNFTACVRLGQEPRKDVKLVLDMRLDNYEIIRKVDADSLESVTRDIENKYKRTNIRTTNKETCQSTLKSKVT